MGYDFHITRRKKWADDGDDITAEEWRAYVRTDTELTLTETAGPNYAVWRGPSEHSEPWLDWSSGQIFTKNPDAPLIDKMIAIAETLDATVQGDDGEIYDERAEGLLAGHTLRQRTQTFRERVAGWFSRTRPTHTVAIEHQPLPFGVGDRVRDSWGNEHIVTSIDPAAEHGMGVIRTRRSDGTALAHMMFAHGLVSVVPGQTSK